MGKYKIKRVAAFILAVAMVNSLCGCSNIIKEQWDVVEQYRLEHATTEKAEKKKEATTTQQQLVQNVLADFINEEEMTLGLRVVTPNGYVRVNWSDAEQEAYWKAIAPKLAQQEAEASGDGVKTGSNDAKQNVSADAVSGDSFGNMQGLGADVTSQGGSAGTTMEAGVLATTEGAIGTAVQPGSTTEGMSPALGTTSERTTETATTQEATTQERFNNSGVTYTIEEFMRSLPVRSKDAKVKLYTKEEKAEQDSHIAIFNLPVDSRNLQQRGSSMMRLYAEYYWTNHDYDNMKYHLLDNFAMEYERWTKGERLNYQNNAFSWYSSDKKGDSYETLLEYLEYYFSYTGMSTLLAESHKADVNNISVGDFFVDEKKENAAMVVDVAVDEDGDRCFLLASGGTPAQEIEILKNPAHEDPWYYVSEIKDTFQTPDFELSKTCYHLTTVDTLSASGDASGNGTASGNAASTSESAVKGADKNE